MRASTPTFRQISWPLVIPQMLVMAGIIAVLYAIFKPASWERPVALGAAIYLLYSYGSRTLLTRSQRQGMALARQKRYQEAIAKFEDSYQFFSRYVWIDRFRTFVLMTPSAISYREMALLNMAYCYVQIKNLSKAKAYYQQTLAEFPDSERAKVSLQSIEAAEQRK
ncbi:MAG: tetratricopeptide repeat protein [Anaerolineae bacterium]|nr:tetratricopeptide repeat protein [Anaerolineae bacterium]